MPSSKPDRPPTPGRHDNGWRYGENDSFDRLAAFSAWLLLVIYNDESQEYINEYADLVAPPIRAPKQGFPEWGAWKRLDERNSRDFHSLLEGVILPNLEKLYSGTDHPLALVPRVLRGIPDGPLCSMYARALDCLKPDGQADVFDEIFGIWQHWKITAEDYYGQFPSANSWDMDYFLGKVLTPHNGERFVDLFAGAGETAQFVAAGSSSMHLVSQDVTLGVIAVVAAILRGQNPEKITISSESPYDIRPELRPADVIIAAPPWGYPVRTEGSRRSQQSELATMVRVMETLAPGGRAAVYVPYSFLFGGGARKGIRERLLTEFRLDAVVNVPATKGKGARPKGAVIYFTKAESRSHVWFVSEEDYSNAMSVDFDSPWEQALEAALQSRVGLIPTKILESGEKLVGDEWIDRIEQELSEAEADTADQTSVDDDPVTAEMLKIARGFRGELDDESFESQNFVSLSELACRDFELLQKPADWDAYESFLRQIALIPGASVKTLGEIATVRRGTPLRSSQLEKWNALGRLMNLGPEKKYSSTFYLRISDLPKTAKSSRFVHSAKTLLSCEAEGLLNQTAIAESGDIALSIDGTIGMSAVIDQGIFEGAGFRFVPSQGIALIRLKDKTPLTSMLIADLLMSPPYQQMLSALSLGSTVRHLRISDLREIRIPLLPPAERVRLKDAIMHSSSFESLLEAISSKGGYTRALKRLLEAPEWQGFVKSDPSAPTHVQHQLLKDLVAASTAFDHGADDTQDPFLAWTNEFAKAARELGQILDYARGSDQLAALQGWRNGMKAQSRPYHAAWEALRQKNRELLNDQKSGQMTGAVFNHCEKLHTRLWDLAIRTADELLVDVSVTASLEPTNFVVGTIAEATLHITNHSPLPLRNLSVKGDGIEDLTLPILPAGGTRKWGISLDTSTVGKLTRKIRWSALTLNEIETEGSLEIVASVSSPDEDSKLADLGYSPYVYARVLDEKSENVFKGRRKAIEQILSAIDRPDASTIVLVEGNRRIGKTSLLKYFIRKHLPSGKVAVFINFQDFDGETGANARAGIPTVNVFRGMARELVRAAVDAVPQLSLPGIGPAPSGSRVELITYYRKAEELIDEKTPFQSFRNLTEIVRAAIAPHCLLFLLDEFDRLQEGIESGVTSDQVPENLRHLFQTWNDLSGVFTGSRTIRRLRQEYWNVLFGLGQTVRLYGLDPEEARQLIENPVEGRLIYASNAVDEICRITARQPLLIQGMCERLFRMCKASGQRSISLSMVANAAAGMVEDSEHFESIWAYIGTDRRRLLVFLIDEQERIAKGATFERIQELLEENGLKPTAQEIHSDLEELVDLEVVHRTQNQGLALHKIEIPLFSRWLNGTKDISQYRASALEE